MASTLHTWLRDLEPELKKPLTFPLARDEKPWAKLSTLRTALDCGNSDEGLVRLAQLVGLPGFNPKAAPKRPRRGRPSVSTVMLEKLWGHAPTTIPEWAHVLLERKLFTTMDALRKGSALRRTVAECAREVLKNPSLDGSPNPFHVQSAKREQRKCFSKSIADLYEHRSRRNNRHQRVIATMQTQWPHWPRYEQFLLDVLPFYVKDCVSGGQTIDWEAILARCERTYGDRTS